MEGTDSANESRENTNKVYEAIKNFIDELYGVYDTGKPTPLALYHRVISKIALTEYDRVDKVVGGFAKFCEANASLLLSATAETSFPDDLKIEFIGSPKIFVQISTFYNQASPDVRNVILSHLLAISTLLEKDGTRAQELIKKYTETSSSVHGDNDNIPLELLSQMNIDTSTDEGKFVGDIVNKVTDIAKNIDMSNPIGAIGELMSNGALEGLLNIGADGSAAPDPKKLMKVFKKMLNDMIPDE